MHLLCSYTLHIEGFLEILFRLFFPVDFVSHIAFELQIWIRVRSFK